ncbi:MAG TPA: PAS domain-containing protein [Burkholderiales bacterium]|nr:PAS domain-containing protein [Burkholderiales bacterium]
MANLAADLDDRLRALERELEQLAADRQRYAELFAFAPEACVVTDVDGIILEANRAADALLDGRGALRGKALDAFVPMEQRRIFLAQTSAAIEGPGCGRFFARLRRPGGDVAVEVSLQRLGQRHSFSFRAMAGQMPWGRNITTASSTMP